MYIVKKDAFRDARGGYSKILDIECEHCDNHICYYQKDGPGSLRRMYADRMIDFAPVGDILGCNSCGRTLGIKIIWEKEGRPAYRLFVESVTKKITNRRQVSSNGEFKPGTKSI